ncbi:hypothetical protein MA16_Dca023312 [Dendrobium catenatum]|uniref:Uncharacterized protein n=1 Tax=Dendrobium catenatum TaxID=906689 RepID=A0A2I0WE17_9ASPA|nr:hypothetical protein MA16_Dca023312 [Dendrobium catenatum]
MSKPFEDAYELIEEMKTNNFMWPVDRVNINRLARVYENNSLYILTTQVAGIFKKLDELKVNSDLRRYSTTTPRYIAPSPKNMNNFIMKYKKEFLENIVL